MPGGMIRDSTLSIHGQGNWRDRSQNLRGKHRDTEQQQPAEFETLPVHRYFDALEGQEAVGSAETKILSVILCIAATLSVAALLVTTIIHALLHRDLFPNDMAIAISERRPRTRRRWYRKRAGSSDTSTSQYLKYFNSDGKDIETASDSSVSGAEVVQP